MGLWHLSDSDLIECADGGAFSERHAAAAAHLSRCRRCADRVARASEAAKVVQSLSSAAAPSSLRHRVARALREERALDISCEQAAPLLQECVDGCLSPFAAVALQQHLRTCAKCEQDLKALTAVVASVRALPVVAAASGVRARVRQASLHATRPVSLWLGWRPVAAAAAAALLLGALSLMRPAPPRPTDLQPPAPRTEASTPATLPMEVASLSPSAALPAGGEAALEQTAETPVVEHVDETLPRPVVPTPARVRLTGTLPTGPAPAPVTPVSSEPRVAVPAAFAALRAVKAASDEAAVQRAMELAGERFATLRSEALSEATLVQLPPVGNEPASETRPSSLPRSAPPAAPESPVGGESSGSNPREGASLLAVPFV